MTTRIPLTLFTHIHSITPHATWSDPLNPSDPWNGYPYQWRVVIDVQSQTHSDPSTPRPYTYNGLDISIGDWLIFTGSGQALEIISLISQTDTDLTILVEDVSLHNLLNDPAQSGNGIGRISADNVYDCLIINLNPSGIPIFANLPDYSVPINLVSDITNRFQFRNYVQDFIPAFQAGHTFVIDDVIYLSSDGVYHKSYAGDPGSVTSIGTITSINQPNIGDFTYRPIGRYVNNLPLLPGNPGQYLYVSDTTPGELTASIPSPVAIPIYIKIDNYSAILTSGSGGGGGAVGNISIIGNNITAINTDGNINLIPNGNGIVNIPTANVGNLLLPKLTPNRIVLSSANGQLIDSEYFTYDIGSQYINIGNIQITTGYISTATSGVPLLLSANNSNVQILNTLDVSSNKIINLQDPTDPQDAATKYYVDAVASGLDTKQSVVYATTSELDAAFTPLVGYGSLTSNIYTQFQIDGYYPNITDRILVKNQSNELENGIYTVVQQGSISEPWLLTRSSDYNGQGTAGHISSGSFVFVEEGYQNGGTGWVMTTPNPITVNVSPIHWTQFSSAGVIQAGFGLEKIGTTLDVNVAAIINTTTGLSAVPGPLGKKIIEIYLDTNTPLEFYNGSLRVQNKIAGTGLSYSLTSGNLSVNNTQPTITGLGNITSGTWSADVINYQYGGTGMGTLGLPGQVIGVNLTGTNLEYINHSQITESSDEPYDPPPVDGDRWFNTDIGVLFTRITDVTGSHWVEL